MDEHRLIFQGDVEDVRSVCAFTQDSTPFLATVGGYGIIRIWDLARETEVQTFDYLGTTVDTICAFTHGDSTLLAAGGVHGRPLIVDPFGDRRRIIRSYEPAIAHDVVDGDSPINAICAFTLDETTLLATANANHTLRIWSLSIQPFRRTLYERDQTLHGHEDIVNCVCPISLGGTILLASGSNDRTVRIWDPAKGASALVIPTRDEDCPSPTPMNCSLSGQQPG